VPSRSGPHQEGSNYGTLKFHGPCTPEQFRKVLSTSRFPSIEEGFEAELPRDQKFLPVNHGVQRSFITIEARPSDVEIAEDSYNPGKIKLHFRDKSGRAFRYIGVTDLGFHDHARRHHQSNDLAGLNGLLQAQDEVFLRIGLSRAYMAPGGRHGFWLQANGISTFPYYHEATRSYSP